MANSALLLDNQHHDDAIKLGNDLHDELHITIDRIRMEVSAEASVLVYRDLVRQAKTYLLNLTGDSSEDHQIFIETSRNHHA